MCAGPDFQAQIKVEFYGTAEAVPFHPSRETVR
jgi:hypothetical protein